ncbi:MAG TPA: HD domain-containing protein [Sporichthya sp.]|nr:HD domain-containing protein [Sporichthya sp.]
MRANFDYAWGTETGGKLSGRQKRALVGPLLQTVADYTGDRAALALRRRGSGRLDLDDLKVPDSRLARDAEEEAREGLSPAFLHHSYRMYLFGQALAQIEGVPVDDEVAYVACLLHEFGLENPTPGRCFAVVGAERAERFALDRDVEPERARRIAAEINGHLNLGQGRDMTSEGGFLSAGAMVDVFGLRLNELAPDWVDQVLARHPRHDFKRYGIARFKAEGRANRDGRAAWLNRYALCIPLWRIAPFKG